MSGSIGTPVTGNGNGTGASITLTLASPGYAIIVYAEDGTTVGSMSCSSSIDGAFPAQLTGTVDATYQCVLVSFCKWLSAGTHTITVTGISGSFNSYGAYPILGISNGWLDKVAAQFQATPGTGTDAVTSGATATLAAANSFVFGFGALSNTGLTLTAGTGFTDAGATGFTQAAITIRVEGKSITSSTGAATFTESTATASQALAIVFSEVSPGGPTITSQPSDQQVASGSTATFTANATATGGGSLSWQATLAGSPISGATGSGGSASHTTSTLGYSDDLGLYGFAFTETGGTNDGTTNTNNATLYVGTRVVGANTPVYSTSGGTTVAPSYSTLPTIAAGDEIVLVVAQKPSTANSGSVTTPSGYTLQGSLTGAGGYSTTLGNNTGNTNLFVYTQDTVTGSETGAVTVTVGTNGVCSAFFILLRPISGSTVSYGFASGSDTSAGNVSITCGSDPGETAGDIVLQIFNGSSNAILPFSAEALTTTGITYSAVTELVEYGTTVGNDVAGYVASAKAISGTSSAAPVFTATVGGTNTNARGPGVLLRMRASAPPAASVGTLATQRRAPGFPPRGPLPGIARVGLGILVGVASGATGNAGTASAATSSFAVAASGAVTFDAAGSVATSSFAASGTGTTPVPPIPAPMPAPQPQAFGVPTRSPARIPAPPPILLGRGVLVPSAVAAPSFSGSGNAALSPSAITASGLITFTGTGSAATSSFAASASGVETFTGSGSAAESAFAVSGSGAETFAATASAAMSPFATSGAGAEAFASTASVATSPFAVTGSSAETFTGTATASPSSFASSGSGIEQFDGSGSVALSSFTIALSGVFAIPGPMAQPQPRAVGFPARIGFPAGLLGRGLLVAPPAPIPNTGTAAVSPFAISASGLVTFTATGSAAISSFALAASALETFAASAAAAMSPFAESSSGLETFTGTASAATQPFACAATGSAGSGFTCSGSAAISSFAASSAGAETFTGSAASSTSPFAPAGTGNESQPISGSASCATSSFGSAGSGSALLAISGTCAAALASFNVSGASPGYGTLGPILGTWLGLTISIRGTWRNS